MKRILLPLMAVLAFTGTARAQYYYKDILSNRQAHAELDRYRENKIHTVKVKSFEDDGEPSDGFFCEKKISRDYKKTEMMTRSNVSGRSFFTSWYDDNGLLQKTIDSSDIASTTNTYTYDAQKRIISIISSARSSDDDFTNEVLEEHIYHYGSLEVPVEMIRVKNRRDSIKVLFMNDEKNNLSIEKDSRSGSKYYYYYDAKNRLTDIAHSNEFKPKLLADYQFEYDALGNIIQMVNTEEGGNDYFTWKYNYDNGLRSRERLFTKERKLMGSIEYEYK